MRIRLRSVLLTLGAVAAVGGGLAGVILVPRLPAMRCLLGFQDAVPKDLKAFDAPPEGFRLLSDPGRYGVRRAWVRRPEGKGPFPILVFIHGVAAEGIRDGRILRAVSAFARGGFLVVAPEVRGLVDPTERDGDEDRLARLLEAVAGGALPEGKAHRLGVVGISVGGAIALRSCARFRAGGGRGLRAALAIGAPADIRRPARQWFSLPNPAEEGDGSFTWRKRNAAAFARNFVSRAALAKRFGNSPDRAVLRDWLARKWIPDAAPDGLTTQAGFEFVVWFLSQPDRWAREGADLLAEGWDQFLPLSPIDWKGELRHLRGTAIFLLHGEGDPLVPVDELAPLRDTLAMHTVVSTLRSRMVGHTRVESVGVAERIRHLTFMDDFFDMVR